MAANQKEAIRASNHKKIRKKRLGAGQKTRGKNPRDPPQGWWPKNPTGKRAIFSGKTGQKNFVGGYFLDPLSGGPFGRGFYTGAATKKNGVFFNTRGPPRGGKKKSAPPGGFYAHNTKKKTPPGDLYEKSAPPTKKGGFYFLHNKTRKGGIHHQVAVY